MRESGCSKKNTAEGIVAVEGTVAVEGIVAVEK